MIISNIDKTVKGTKYQNHFNYTYRYYSDGELEFTWFDDYQLFGKNGGRKMKTDKSQVSEERKELYRYQARLRAGSNIRQLVKENNLGYMWTLTYKADVSDREQALYDFKKFILRLNYHLKSKIPYVAVTEVQKKRYKRTGTPVLHFHMAIDRYIDFDLLTETWAHGYVYVSKYESGQKIEGKDDISKYLSKYLKKDMEDNPQLEGKKLYLNSKGLKRPNKGHGVATKEEKNEITSVTGSYEIAEGVSGSSVNMNKILITA